MSIASLLLKQLDLLASCSTAVLAPVHEQVLVSRVAVDVDVQVDVSALQCLPHHLLHGRYLWSCFDTWVDVLTVQVKPCQTAAVVADNDPIWVEHGYDLENKDVPQLLCFLLVTKQQLHYALHDE